MHPRYVAQGMEKARKTISDGLELICNELHIPPAEPVPFERYPELRPLRELEAIAERVDAIAGALVSRAETEAEAPESATSTEKPIKPESGPETPPKVTAPANTANPVHAPIEVRGIPQAAKQRPGKDLRR